MKNFIALYIAVSFATFPVSAWSIDVKTYSGPTIRQGTATFAPATGTIAPGGQTNAPIGGATVATELTINECKKLGCTVQDDNKCVALIIGSGMQVSKVQKRCVCSSGSSCITAAAQ